MINSVGPVWLQLQSLLSRTAAVTQVCHVYLSADQPSEEKKLTVQQQVLYANIWRVQIIQSDVMPPYACCCVSPTWYNTKRKTAAKVWPQFYNLGMHKTESTRVAQTSGSNLADSEGSPLPLSCTSSHRSEYVLRKEIFLFPNTWRWWDFQHFLTSESLLR